MKIRISFPIDIDADAWATEYGLEPSEVRKDVQEYVRNAIIDYMAERGMLAE